MAYVKKDPVPVSENQRVRVTMTSRIPKSLERVVSDILTRAREEKVAIRGPVRFPTRTLRITTRKTPCGNGTNTWDTFELKIYKRVIDICAASDMVKKITSFTMDAGVDVAITIPER